MSLPAPLTALIQSEHLNNILCVNSLVEPAESKQAFSMHHVTLDHMNAHELMEQTFQKRFDLVWLSDKALELQQEDRNELIAKCRDQLSSRVLLEITNNEEGRLSETDCLALGFVRCAITDQRNYYLFNLQTYKPVPDWLNPRFWANPQNWNKFRW